MASLKECSVIIDGKIQGTDIYIDSDEWHFYLKYADEVFIYVYEDMNIYCCRNGGDSWCAYSSCRKAKFHLGTSNNITVERMKEVGQKILDKLTSPNNET